jgi:arylsulfatase A-like enzyme
MKKLLLILCTTLGFACAGHSAGTLPNIVYILADDLGLGDLGCYGQTKIHTPNIDRIAAEGMKFTQHYSGSTVCAPSRCTLMTGYHTGHTFVRSNKEAGQGYAGAEGQLPIPANTITIAKLLKERGYATGAFGKWGLGGPGTEGVPNRQGFDLFFGYLCQRQAHTYYPEHLWRNDEMVKLDGNVTRVDKPNRLVQVSAKTYSPDVITDEAVKWLRASAAKPFFLYLPYTIPHVAIQVPDDSLSEYKGKFPETPYDGKKGFQPQATPHAAYAAMVTRLDGYVGRIMAQLKELGVDDNTIVFFSSDNGPPKDAGTDPDFFGSAGPFRGLKTEVYEGGIRAPFLARWPGHIKPGSQSDHVSAFWDMMPTFMEIAGGKAPSNIDGISLLPTLLGKGTQSEHEYMYWEFHEKGGCQALRLGNWKAVRTQIIANAERPIELYDLSTDIGEKNDVAAKHPDVVAKMDKLMREAHVPSKEFPLSADKLSAITK